MDTDLQTTMEPTTAEQSIPELQVMVIHEDQPSRVRAIDLLDRISQRTGIGNGLVRNMWMASLLHTPLLREQAAVEAASAEVVLLSLTGKRDFTAFVQDWLMRWHDHKETRPYAFAVLLDPDEPGAGPGKRISATVRKAATAGGAAFFCNDSEAATVEIDEIFNEIEVRATSLTAVLEAILKVGHR